jgi:Protein of unknown function (DUF3307)
MFWYLLFAHLLADYPFQSNWMVMQKARFRILLLHIVIHLVTLLVVVGAARRFVWQYLLLLVLVHFSVDLAKNYVNKIQPAWIIGPYIVDQLVHYASIWLVAYWIENQSGSLPLPFTRTAFIFASAYLLVTYVWFISERILAYSDLSYRKEVVEQIWIRMFSRAAILSGWLLVWRWLVPVNLSATATISLPYLRSKNGVRAFITDFSVAAAGLILILWAI